MKSYNRQLRDLIIEGRADPSWVVSHRVESESYDKIVTELINIYEAEEMTLFKSE